MGKTSKGDLIAAKQMLEVVWINDDPELLPILNKIEQAYRRYRDDRPRIWGKDEQ